MLSVYIINIWTMRFRIQEIEVSQSVPIESCIMNEIIRVLELSNHSPINSNLIKSTQLQVGNISWLLSIQETCSRDENFGGDPHELGDLPLSFRYLHILSTYCYPCIFIIFSTGANFWSNKLTFVTLQH